MNPAGRLLLACLLSLSCATASTAIQVTPGSHCAIHCLDSPAGNDWEASESNTYTADISCKDADYSTTDAGIKFRQCIECLQASPKVSKSESDLKWYIYNLRFTVTTCLFGSPKPLPDGTVASQCNVDTACKSLDAPLTADQLQPNPRTTWDYCITHRGAFMAPALSSCMNCLQATKGEAYLSNFLAALQIGCLQDPSDGDVLSLSGSIFSTASANMTVPRSSRNDQPSDTLSTSALAFLAVGVILIFVVALGLLIVHFRRENTLDAEDRARFFRNHYGPYSYPTDSSHRSRALCHYRGNAFGGPRPFSFSSTAAAARSADDNDEEMKGKYKITEYTPDFLMARTENHASSTTGVPNDASIRGDDKIDNGDDDDDNSSSNSNNHHHHETRTENPSTPPALPITPPPLLLQIPTSGDSPAFHQHLQASEECTKLALRRPAPSEQVTTTPPTARPERDQPLSRPSLSKWLAMRFTHLSIPLPTATCLSAQREHELPMAEHAFKEDLPFRKPSFRHRLINLPLWSGSPPPRPQEVLYNGYIEVPLRSGKSTLYGY